MKRQYIYIIGAALVLTVVILLARNNASARSFSEKITLRKEDKIPYGSYAARNLLPALFPKATIVTTKDEPDNWGSEFAEVSNQAVVSVSKNFYADEDELFDMLRYVKDGNYVFIATQSLSEDAQKFFHLTTSKISMLLQPGDSLALQLEKPPFASDTLFKYPGSRYSNWVYDIDTLRTVVLGRDGEGRPQFVKIDAGSGSLFIHLAPVAFSNYFILHKQNINYFEQVLSVIPPNIEKLTWNEYYLSRKSHPNQSNDGEQPSFLRVLMQEPSFAWALWTAIATLLLYTLLEMRRKQRFIPAHVRPRNDSLDFIKTIGRLYYDRKDHHNLARKMSVYFLEHVRTNYKLSTQKLDESFIEALHFKTGYNKERLARIAGIINFLDTTEAFSETQLSAFYKELESFYQTT